MIDTKELRRLAQAAIAKMNASDPEFASSTPPPLAILALLDRLEAAEKERDDVAEQLVQSEIGKRKISKECESYKAAYNDWADKTEWVQQGFNEGTISAKYFGLHRADVMARLLDEAEKEREIDEQRIADFMEELNRVGHEIDTLRAKIEAAEKERDNANAAAVNIALEAERLQVEIDALRANIEAMERQDCSKQSVPAEVPREFVMDAIAQALGDAYDCTRVWSAWGYGTMSHDDFQLIAEDGDRLREIADAAIMAMGVSAPKPCAQPAPSVPDGWLRAIDEALVVAHVGVANEIDTYEQAKAKLDSLLGFHVDAATDPAVNGGWKLVPRPPTPTMVKAGLESSHVLNVHRVLACYDAMIDAAPEAKP